MQKRWTRAVRTSNGQRHDSSSVREASQTYGGQAEAPRVEPVAGESSGGDIGSGGRQHLRRLCCREECASLAPLAGGSIEAVETPTPPPTADLIGSSIREAVSSCRDLADGRGNAGNDGAKGT